MQKNNPAWPTTKNTPLPPLNLADAGKGKWTNASANLRASFAASCN